MGTRQKGILAKAMPALEREGARSHASLANATIDAESLPEMLSGDFCEPGRSRSRAVSAVGEPVAAALPRLVFEPGTHRPGTIA